MENLKGELENLYPDLLVNSLPNLETDLVKNRGPSLWNRMERIRFFCRLFCEIPEIGKQVFLAAPEGLIGQAPPPEFWQKELLIFKRGEALSRTDLQAQLSRLGYLPAELVERESEYAVRGSIVDVYSPLYDHPVRLELFGDEIQSLKLFHPDSQRTIEDLNSLAIPPVREFLFPEDMSAIKSEVRRYLDVLDWERRDRDALLGRLEQKAFFPTIDLWAPLIDRATFTQAEKFLDAIGQKVTAVFEAPSLERETLQSLKQVERHFLQSRTEAEWVPEAAAHLLPPKKLQEFVAQALERADWLSTKLESFHPLEPATKKTSPIRSHDRLIEKLRADRLNQSAQPLAAFQSEIREQVAAGVSTILVGTSTSQLERIAYLLQDYHLSFKIFPSFESAFAAGQPLSAFVGDIERGFYDAEAKLSLLLDEELLGAQRKRKHKSRHAQKASQVFSPDLALLDLRAGDLVVHSEHGIGRYLGLKSFQVQGQFTELLEIEYKEAAKLLVPVTRLSQIQKFSAAGTEAAALDRLGGQSWESKKSRAKASLKNIAGELLHLYSERELAHGPEIAPSAEVVQKFAASFPFEETPDQALAIEAILKDLRGPKPMDRLLCGDVGYGKTEVALRAAHAVISAGYQVAVLVPTTLLATQHENTFRKRLEPFGFRVEGLSRFKSARETKQILKNARDGTTQVIIGTHRLLGNDITLDRLGLMVVDEEQKFGVSHKEKLKRFKNDVHILSMTATPIPRTLNMAMSGIKDLSIITTPPQDRLSVRTHVAKWKDELIQEAVDQEVRRGGQVFFIHNRVQSIGKVLEKLKILLPHVSMEFVHGQMEEETLEARMMNFYEGRTQLLLTTSIIESGLDVPNANTLIIDRADTFGLAQLYQMRGRVGRSSQRAYAYFLLPREGNITQDAEERLSVLESYQELGSGFHIASHDLEIRGSGELLGREQSGHIAAIGFDTYTQLLQESVAEIRGEVLEKKIEPEIQLGIDTHIPETFIPEVGLRLMFYRKLAASADEHEVDAVEKEMEDRFGHLPKTVHNLAVSMRIRCQLRRLGIKGLTAGKTGFSIFFASSTPVNPAKLVESIRRYPAHFQMSPEGKLFLKRPEGKADEESILRGVEGALAQLETWIG